MQACIPIQQQQEQQNVCFAVISIWRWIGHWTTVFKNSFSFFYGLFLLENAILHYTAHSGFQIQYMSMSCVRNYLQMMAAYFEDLYQWNLSAEK